MAFVPGFQHDVFVSYAHTDDQPLPGVNRGWVTFLVESLKVKLNQELGRAEADIFIDQRLSRHEGVTAQLQEKLRQSATLLVVLSPGFLASDWCRRERALFLDEDLKGRLRAGARLFLVQRSRIERERWPTEFADLKGFQFFLQDGLRTWTICQDCNLQRDSQEASIYLQRLDELTSELAEELKRLRTAADGTDGERDTRPRVWLAEVTDDLDERRDEMRRYLRQVDIRVLPEGQYELGPEKLGESMSQYLAGCKAFVQLLSEIRGKLIPRLGQTRARFQYEKAKAAGLTILQWRDPDLDLNKVTDLDQRSLIEPARAERFGDFMSAVKEVALQKPAAPRAIRRRAMVFVDTGEEDLPIAEAICRELETDVDVSLPSFAVSPHLKPSEVRSKLEKDLADCQALIVIYGSSPAAWVKEHIIESRKILYSGAQELLALAVYVGPPAEKPPVPVRGQFIHILDGRAGLGDAQRDQLRAFVRAIPAVQGS